MTPPFGDTGSLLATSYPRVYGWNAKLTLANLDIDLRRLWDKLPEPKLFVYLWNGAYQENSAATVSLLRAAIANLLGISPPIVAPPSAAAKPRRAHAALWCFLVTSVSSEARAKLIHGQFWSTPTVTFFAIPFAPQISRHLGAIENLTFSADDQAEVQKLIRDTILASPPVGAHIHSHNQDPDALWKLTNSIDVKPLPMLEKGGAPKLVWNVYADPPSSNLSSHEDWRRTFLEMKFVTALHGVGKPKCLSGCTGCKSTDHPTGLCPFPKIEGSFARPSSTSIQSLIPTSLELPHMQRATRGRGSRGRGANSGQRGRSRGRGSPAPFP